MKIIEDPYIGKKLKSTYGADSIIGELGCGITDRNYYVIALSSNEKNQLDIIHTFFLKQAWQRAMVPAVAGAAFDRMEAALIVDEILCDAMDAGYGYDMRTFLNCERMKR